MVEEKLTQLEERVGKLEQDLNIKLSDISKFMSSLDEELKRMNRGIYGDKDNQTKGLMDRQLEDEKRFSNLEKRVDAVYNRLLDEVGNINLKSNIDGVKKETTQDLLKKLRDWGVTILIGFLILKDVVGIETLMEIFLRK